MNDETLELLNDLYGAVKIGESLCETYSHKFLNDSFTDMALLMKTIKSIADKLEEQINPALKTQE